MPGMDNIVVVMGTDGATPVGVPAPESGAADRCDIGLRRYLGAMRRCRLCKFLAAAIFAAIFAVELAILIPSYQGYRKDLLDRLDFAGLAAVRTVLDVAPALRDDMSLTRVPTSSETALILSVAAMRSKSIGGTPLVGGLLFNDMGMQVGQFGMTPSLIPSDGRQSAMPSGQPYYDVVWTPEQHGLPYTVVGRLDASHVPGQLTAFVFRILGLVLIISLVVCGATMLIFGRYVLSPLLALDARLKAAGNAPEEAASRPLVPLRNDELGDVVKAFNQATVRVADTLGALRQSRSALASANEMLEHKVADRTRELTEANAALTAEVEERKRAMAKADYLANHDPLTDLPNRHLFTDLLQHEMGIARRQDTPLALTLLDIDNFKDINDTLGHEVGDALLKQTADRLRRSVREHDTVARLGGDEFAIIQTCLDAAELSASQARRLLKVLGEPYPIGDKMIAAPASIGIAMFPADAADSETLQKNVELAMYRAKQERGTFAYYDQGLDEEVRRRRTLEQEMRIALEKGQYQLHYQPKHAFAGGKVAGAEALIRWQHPDRGMISPGEFIPIAERTGLIAGIGEWALFEAARQFRDFEAAEGLAPVAVAVNLSAVQLRDRDIPKLVRQVLEDTRLPPARLELEITESVVMDDVRQTVEVLEALNAIGIGLSIDDFGTGYSSLSYLRQLPVNKMKIDRAFVMDVDTSGDAAVIARAIVGLGQSLNLKIVAEGVETAAQYAYLKGIGCTEAQGFYLSRPLPAAAFEAYLRTH